MGRSSRAAVLVGPRRFELQEIPLPTRLQNGGLLEIEVCGVCGSDIPTYLDGPATPVILGHEIVGTIREVGGNWAGPPLNTRVAVERWIPCGHCDQCLVGRYRFCVPKMSGEPVFYGGSSTRLQHGLWGGFAEFLYLHPHAVLYPIADNVPASISPLYTPLANALSWLHDLGELRAGQMVAIEGPGQEGLCAVAAARMLGAGEIVVLGKRIDRARLQLATRLGADHTIIVDDQDPIDTMRDLTNGNMADIVLDVTSAPTGLPSSLALDLVRFGGHVVIGAIHSSAGPCMNPDKIVDKIVTVRGARGRERWAVQAAIRALETRGQDFQEMCAIPVGLESIESAFQLTAREREVGTVHVSVAP